MLFDYLFRYSARPLASLRERDRGPWASCRPHPVPLLVPAFAHWRQGNVSQDETGHTDRRWSPGRALCL